MDSKQIRDEIEERSWEFADEFGADGFFEDGVVKSIEAIHSLCVIIFGEEVADSGLSEMLGAHFADVVAELGWRRALEEEYNGIYSEMPIGALFHDLEAYAGYGIIMEPVADADDRYNALQQKVRQAEAFLKLLPIQAWDLEAEHLINVAKRALVRWKLDHDQPITGVELASVGKLAIQTVKNNVSNSHKTLSGNMAKISASDALAWLATKGFKDSIWKHQGHDEPQAMPFEPITSVFFVPHAKDGSVFAPHLRQGGHFRVGSDTHEEKVSTFKEALLVLQSAAIPIWRRPTEKGRWTRVRGIGWKRLTQAELGRLAVD